ncbi:putative leucine-rich repeat-containing protein DDB_G0290503 [Lytechinus variegatus]|uniref:putative leucine-rich repeat-containing protein DDB_G0290503 n=1 Tax=Lytechinus variegatus TaxID=7654 RepID=UPI001BB194AF|nr:putative leucine-rich repeat-containing protein DDB_G0290503 [Lytechinus variegatus]
MDILKLRDLLMELVEELKITRAEVTENEDRIQQLVNECHDKERKLEEEALNALSLRDKHTETEDILSKTSDDKMKHLESEKSKLQLAVEGWEKEMKTMKEVVRALELSKYNQDKTVRELQHRLQTQERNKTAHAEQVLDIDNKCKGLQKDMTFYRDALGILKREVSEAGVLNMKLTATNTHQRCEISSLKEDLDKKQQDVIKLRAHVTGMPDNESNKREMIELKIEELTKELKQVALINQDLKTQYEEGRRTNQVTQTQLQESQDLLQRFMTSTDELKERTTQQETKIATLMKEYTDLSERYSRAKSEVAELRQVMNERDSKKKTEVLRLEEENEKMKSDLSKVRKTVLNLEDINASWASKNHAITEEMEDLKMKLESSSAELDKMKLPIHKSDMESQTNSNTNLDNFDTSSITTGAKDPKNAETFQESEVTVEPHTMEQKIKEDAQLIEQKMQQEEVRNNQKEDITFSVPEPTNDSLIGDNKQCRNDNSDVQETNNHSSDNFKDDRRIGDVSVMLMENPTGKDDRSSFHGMSAEGINQHQFQRKLTPGTLDRTGYLTEDLHSNAEDSQLKTIEPGQDGNEIKIMRKTISNTVSLDASRETLKGPAKVSYIEDSQAHTDDKLLEAETGNDAEAETGNDAEDILPVDNEQVSEMQEDKTSHMIDIDTAYKTREGTANQTQLLTDTSAVLGNLDKVEVCNEDILIPSTYEEENLACCRGQENQEMHQADLSGCENDAVDSSESMLPVDVQTERGKINSPLCESLVSYHKGAKPVEQIANKSKSSLTSVLTEADVVPETKEAEHTNKIVAVENYSLTETTVLKGAQCTSSSYSGHNSRHEKAEPATSLCGSGNYSSLWKKGKFSLTTEPTCLQTSKQKMATSLHQLSSPPFLIKSSLSPSDMASCPLNSDSEAVSTPSNTDDRYSLAKTRLTWSSPAIMRTNMIGRATPYSSRKDLDPLRMQPTENINIATETPHVSYSHSSAQQLHQSLRHIVCAPSFTSTSESTVTSIDQKCTVPKSFEISQECTQEASKNSSIEIQETVPRPGRPIFDKQSNGEDQEKTLPKQDPKPTTKVSKYPTLPFSFPNRPPPVIDQVHGGAGDAGGDASLFSDEEGETDMADDVASQINRIQNFLKKDRLKRAKLE